MNMISSSTNKLDYIWNTYGIPLRYIEARFSNYYPTCPEQMKAKEICQNFAQNNKAIFNRGQGLFLQGPVGTGKSHLSVATLRAIIEANIDSFGCQKSETPIYGEQEYHGFSCTMISVVEFLGSLRQSYSAKNLKHLANRLLHQAKICEIIILDDIGAEKPSDWGEEQLFSLIDLRYRMQRSTILTSNCTLKELEAQLGDRLVSRIFEMCEGVKVGGEDYRKGGPNLPAL